MMKSGKLQKILYAALILVLLAGLTVSFLFNPYNRMSVEAKQSFLSIDVGDNLSAPDSPELSDDNGLNKKIYYTDAQNQKQFVDNSWQVAALPWNWQMTHDDYTVRVKNLITDGQVIEFGRDGETVYLQPSNLQWTNDLGQIQLISIPTNTSTTVDSKATDLTSSRTNNEGFIQWDDAYGSGINFQWQCTPGVLKKTLEIESLKNLTAPEKYIIDGKNPRLELTMVFAPSKNLQIYTGDTLWEQKTKVQTFDIVRFVKDGEELWHFNPLQYWCSDNGLRDGETITTLDKKGGKLYISIQVPYSWLQEAVYPVYIDADVTVASGVWDWDYSEHGRLGIFWVSTTEGWYFFRDSGQDFNYQKTTNGGASWGSAVEFVTGKVGAKDCFADWQVAGDSGTKIHIVYLNFNSYNADVRYCYLDTATGSIGGDTTVVAVQLDASPTAGATVSITKSRGGNLYIAARAEDFRGTMRYYFYKSTDDGANWTSKASPWESVVNDKIELHPGNEADNNDIWGVYIDWDADAISLKVYDDSGDSWSETAIATPLVPGSYDRKQWNGQVRLSDGHLILAFWNAYDDDDADLEVWDINGAGSITQKTNIITNEDDSFLAAVFINQVNDDIYVSYASGQSAGSLVAVFYQKSTDGGANWGGETAMQADAEDDERFISAGCMSASLGGKFMPVWFNDDTNIFYCNVTNAITINASASLDISNDPSSENLGILDINTTYYAYGSAPSNPVEDGECTFTITNNGSSACDLDMKVGDFTGGVGWNIDATPEANEVKIVCYYSGQDPSAGLVLTNADQEFYDGLAASAHIHWDFSILTGTSFTDGVAKSATLTITAVAED